MRLVSFVYLFAGGIVLQTALADGLIYQLPTDGGSVTFDYEYKATGTADDPTVDIRKGSLTMSSVGETTVYNEKCRWIEFKEVLKWEYDGKERVTITKVLVPENHLGRGKSPGEHLIQGWVKFGDSAPQEFHDLRSPLVAAQGLFLAGPPKEVKDLKQTEINGKLGILQCEGVTGQFVEEQEGGNVYRTFENRLHSTAPFGVVVSLWKIERRDNKGAILEAGTVKFTLRDTQNSALSEMPEKK
jgi:hypothetical protein